MRWRWSPSTTSTLNFISCIQTLSWVRGSQRITAYCVQWNRCSVEYTFRFCTLATGNRWNESLLKAASCHGLNYEILTEMACCDKNISLTSLINLAIYLGNMKEARHASRDRGEPPHSHVVSPSKLMSHHCLSSTQLLLEDFPLDCMLVFPGLPARLCCAENQGDEVPSGSSPGQNASRICCRTWWLSVSWVIIPLVPMECHSWFWRSEWVWEKPHWWLKLVACCSKQFTVQIRGETPIYYLGDQVWLDTKDLRCTTGCCKPGVLCADTETPTSPLISSHSVSKLLLSLAKWLISALLAQLASNLAQNMFSSPGNVELTHEAVTFIIYDGAHN